MNSSYDDKIHEFTTDRIESEFSEILPIQVTWPVWDQVTTKVRDPVGVGNPVEEALAFSAAALLGDADE